MNEGLRQLSELTGLRRGQLKAGARIGAQAINGRLKGAQGLYHGAIEKPDQ